jgi:CTD kinase subunit beta
MQVEFGMELSNPEDRQILHTAWYISMDLNYTFALLKNATTSLALASVELAFHLHNESARWESVFPEPQGDLSQPPTADINNPYKKFKTYRGPVYENMFDLLDLYISHRTSTFAGPFSLETIMAVRIHLNEKAEKIHVLRHAHWRDDKGRFVTPLYVHQLKRDDEPKGNMHDSQRDDSSSLTSPATRGVSPTSPNTEEGGEEPKPPKIIAVRRFILQPEEAEKEMRYLDNYFLTREDEYQVEYEESDGWETVDEGGQGDVLMKDSEKKDDRKERDRAKERRR